MENESDNHFKAVNFYAALFRYADISLHLMPFQHSTFIDSFDYSTDCRGKTPNRLTSSVSPIHISAIFSGMITLAVSLIVMILLLIIMAFVN